MSSTQTIYFPKYDPFKGFNGYVLENEYDNFNSNLQTNINPFTFKVDPEFAKKKTKLELKKMGKEKELELLVNAINSISSDVVLRGDDREVKTKLNFLNKKYEFLEKVPEEKWDYVVGVIVPDLTGKITPSKPKYNNNEIQVIAKILLKIFKHQDIKAHKIVQSNIKGYVNLPLRVFWEYDSLLNEKTSEILVNALSYFVILGKADFVSTILQSIDIFTKKKSEACELYKEILKLGDPKEYDRFCNSRSDNDNNCDDDYIEGNIEKAFEELKKSLEDKLDRDDNTTQEQKVFRHRLGFSFIDKLYDYLEKFNKSFIERKKYLVDENAYIWRYTKKMDGKEIVNWVIDGYDAPEGAHPKYSCYISLNKFLKFVVENKNFFAKRNVLLTTLSLSDLSNLNVKSANQTCKVDQSTAAQQKTICWNGINQSVKNAVKLPIPNQKKGDKLVENNNNISKIAMFCIGSDDFSYCVENDIYASNRGSYYNDDYENYENDAYGYVDVNEDVYEDESEIE
jgi:hypothetical protein